VGPEEEPVIPLFETLVALVESLETSEGSGLVVESATMDVPLEGRVARTTTGPLFLAGVPHTRWRSGILPPLHVAHLGIARVEPGAS
jgi:hypothetical protein